MLEAELDKVVPHIQEVDMASIFGTIKVVDQFENVSLGVSFEHESICDCHEGRPCDLGMWIG